MVVSILRVSEPTQQQQERAQDVLDELVVAAREQRLAVLRSHERDALDALGVRRVAKDELELWVWRLERRLGRELPAVEQSFVRASDDAEHGCPVSNGRGVLVVVCEQQQFGVALMSMLVVQAIGWHCSRCTEYYVISTNYV